jgi:hypothetical protein
MNHKFSSCSSFDRLRILNLVLSSSHVQHAWLFSLICWRKIYQDRLIQVCSSRSEIKKITKKLDDLEEVSSLLQEYNIKNYAI